MGKVACDDFVSFLESVKNVPEYDVDHVFVGWNSGLCPPHGDPFWCFERYDKEKDLFHIHFLDLAMDAMEPLFEKYCAQNGLKLAKSNRTKYFTFEETIYHVESEGKRIMSMHDTICSRPMKYFICVETTKERPAIELILSIPFWYEPPMIRSDDMETYRKLYEIGERA